MAIPRILKNYNMFITGVGFAGVIDEIELPELNIKGEDHRAGGMDAVAVIDMGMDKIECNFSISEPNEQTLALFGLINGRSVQAEFRAAAVDDLTAVPYVVNITGMFTKYAGGTLKAGDKTLQQYTLAARYYRLEFNGNAFVEIDIENMIRAIDGVDQMEEIRAILNM